MKAKSKDGLGFIVSLTIFLLTIGFIFHWNKSENIVRTTMADSEVEIISRRTRNSKVYQIGFNRFRVESYIGSIHYKENPDDINKQWKDIDTTIYNLKVTSAPYTAEFYEDYPAFKISHRKGGFLYEQFVDESNNPVISEGIVNGNKIMYTDVIEFVDIEIIAINSGVKQNVIVKDKKALKKLFKVKLISDNVPEILNNYQIKFGKLIEQIRIWDAEGKEVDFERDFEDGYLKIKVEDMPEIVFPVTIDPTVMDEEVIGASADDGTSLEYDTSFSNSGSYLYAGEYYASGKEDQTYLRFTTITIPNGATIDTAKLTMSIAYKDSGNAEEILADDQANPSTPTTYADHRGRTRTTAGVKWVVTATGEQDTPDISTVVQELVNSYDYSGGANAIQFLIDRHVDCSSYCGIYIRSYDLDIAYGATFNCTYTSGATPTPTPTPTATVTPTPTPLTAYRRHRVIIAD